MAKKKKKPPSTFDYFFGTRKRVLVTLIGLLVLSMLIPVMWTRFEQLFMGLLRLAVIVAVIVMMVGCLSILALVGVAVTAVFVVNQRSYNNCQSSHDDEVIASLTERSGASELDRSALRLIANSGTTMIDVVINPTATPDEKLRAIQAWRAAQAEALEKFTRADNARSQHPLAPPRRC